MSDMEQQLTGIEVILTSAENDLEDVRELTPMELDQVLELSAYAVADAKAAQGDPRIIRMWGGERVVSVCLCYTAFLILVLLIPLGAVQSSSLYRMAQITWFDKLIHLSLFSILTGLYGCVFFPFCRDPSTTIEFMTLRRIGLLVGVVATLGIGLELFQPFFGRSFSWADMATNLSAMVPGFGIFFGLNEVRYIICQHKA